MTVLSLDMAYCSFREVLAGLDTRLDTPPSIDSHHPDSGLAPFLKRSPDTATPDDVRRFQLHLAETGMSICNRNRIMTGVKFLFRITLRRPDLAAEIHHLPAPQKHPS